MSVYGFENLHCRGGGGENETGELKVVRGPGMEFGLL